MTQEEIINRANNAVSKAYEDGYKVAWEEILEYVEDSFPAFYGHFSQMYKKSTEKYSV